MNSAELHCQLNFAELLNIAERDSLEISVKDDMIILTKYEPVDIFNGSKDDLLNIAEKSFKKSIIEMANLAGLALSN